MNFAASRTTIEKHLRHEATQSCPACLCDSTASISFRIARAYVDRDNAHFELADQTAAIEVLPEAPTVVTR